MPPRLPRSHSTPTLVTLLSTPQICPSCLHKLARRNLSTTHPLSTRLRREMFSWLQGPGAVFRQPVPNSTNYINAYDQYGGLIRAKGLKPSRDRSRQQEQEIPKESLDDMMPYPMNRNFRSQHVLSEELRDEIYKRVVERGEDVRSVSASLQVEMGRVGAVVRLKTLEEDWVKEGKPLALPYARAVMSMLPQTRFLPNSATPLPHESINDLPVHKATTLQLFHPTSESRHFTRTDAGRVFDRNLLPAERRIPHPELVQIQKWYNEGLQKDEVASRQRNRNEEEKRRKEVQEKAKRKLEEMVVKKRETPRWEFRFREISVDDVGKDGRARKGVGARYGMPHEDRKKGQVKIPTRVE